MSSGHVTHSWASLPEHVLVKTFHHLSLDERAKCALVCKSWKDAFDCQYLWNNVEINFYQAGDAKYLRCLENHALHIKTLHITLNQELEFNRVNACQLITGMAQVDQRRLQKIKIEFRGENPLFYSGREFTAALQTLFEAPKEDIEFLEQLAEVDLSELPIMLNGELIDCLSANNPKLKKLNVQNRMLICKIHPDNIRRLIERCHSLKELHIHKCSINKDVMETIANSKSTTLRFLSLYCMRVEKFVEDIDGEVWTNVFNKKPQLRVGFWFDPSCELYKVGEILAPEIKVSRIRFETFSRLNDEMKQVARFYDDTLESLVVDTPEMRSIEEFSLALVELVGACKYLKSLRVYCKLEQEVIDKIYELQPHLRNNLNCRLRNTPEVEVFTVGVEQDRL